MSQSDNNTVSCRYRLCNPITVIVPDCVSQIGVWGHLGSFLGRGNYFVLTKMSWSCKINSYHMLTLLMNITQKCGFQNNVRITQLRPLI